MKLAELQANWDAFGKEDPLYAVFTLPTKADRKWDPETFFALGELDVAASLQRIESLGLVLRRGRALDFGCGVGRLSQALAERFQSVVGVDIAPSMIELARRYNRHGERCQYILNEQDNLAILPDASFDFIFSVVVLIHMKPQYARRYVREFLRLLAPGGVALFSLSEPGPGVQAESRLSRVQEAIQGALPVGVRSAYRRAQGVRRPWMEVHGMSERAVTAWLTAHGGRVVHTWDEVPWFRALVDENRARLPGLNDADLACADGFQRPPSPRYCVVRA